MHEGKLEDQIVKKIPWLDFWHPVTEHLDLTAIQLQSIIYELSYN